MCCNSKHITIALFAILIIVWLFVRRLRKEALNENELTSFDMKKEKWNGTGQPRTANFTINEFACKDGSPVPVDKYGNIYELMQQLQILRNEIGVPIMVNSGYRTPSWNKKIGGATNSQHIQCKAADIVATGWTASKLHAKILELIADGKMKDGGLGKYASFVHYDVSTPRRWNG